MRLTCVRYRVWGLRFGGPRTRRMNKKRENEHLKLTLDPKPYEACLGLGFLHGGFLGIACRRGPVEKSSVRIYCLPEP